MRSAARTPVALAALIALVVVGFPTAAHGQSGPGRRRPRIIGGDVAPAGAWPAQAAILDASIADRAQAQICGGTVVAPTWVLTAAHCATDFSTLKPVSPRSLNVLVGTQSLRTGGVRVAVDQVRVDPAFDLAGLSNDLALLHLARPVAVPVMALGSPADLPADGAPLTVAGWGVSDTVERPVQLRQVTVPAVSDADCAALLIEAHRLDSSIPRFDPGSHLCTGPLGSGGKGPCYGDSGGPLVNDAGGHRVQVGVVSWGVSCASPEFPAVFARLASMRQWTDGILRFGPHTDAESLVANAYYRYQYRFDVNPTDDLARDIAALNAGLDPGIYLARIESSPEVQRRDGSLARLYQAILGRGPDLFGWQYWQQRLAFDQISRSRVAEVMARSIEFRTRYGGLDDRSYVDLLYRNVLGRSGDPGGVDYWTHRLQVATATRADVAVGLALSHENVSRTQGVVNVQIAFLDLVNRPPSAAGIAMWSTRRLSDLTRMLLHSLSYAQRAANFEL